MIRKLTILFCLISFCPVAAGAQELALLAKSEPALEQQTTREAGSGINLNAGIDKRAATMMAAADLQGSQVADPPRARKTHTGLTFREFVDVHFGEYRWIYWVGAAAALVALHIAVAD